MNLAESFDKLELESKSEEVSEEHKVDQGIIEEEDQGGWKVVEKKKPVNKNKKKNFGFGGNWITSDNLKTQQARDNANIGELNPKQVDGKPMDVACVTADFAMQVVAQIDSLSSIHDNVVKLLNQLSGDYK